MIVSPSTVRVHAAWLDDDGEDHQQHEHLQEVAEQQHQGAEPRRPLAACDQRQLAQQQEADDQHRPPRAAAARPSAPGDDRTEHHAEPGDAEGDQDRGARAGARTPTSRRTVTGSSPRRRPVKVPSARRSRGMFIVTRIATSDDGRRRSRAASAWSSWKATAVTPKAITADQRYITSTARAWLWPRSSSRWCRCCLSGANGDRPAAVRRTMASSEVEERQQHHRDRQQQRQQGGREVGVDGVGVDRAGQGDGGRRQQQPDAASSRSRP